MGLWFAYFRKNAFDERLILAIISNADGNETLVNSETVGQYTGLKDKTGKKIFEGDIIWDITFDPEMKENHIVMFDEGGFCTEEMFLQSYLCFDEMEVEVIGNIHDNPELLEVAEND